MTRATVQEIATQHGLTTADRIKRPPAAVPEPKADRARVRWPDEKKQLFEQLGPAAVYVAGNEGPQPRYFGDNMGAWPILLGVTESWRDNVTPNMDRLSPLKPRGLIFRVWTDGYANAKKLLALIEGMIRSRIEQGTLEQMRGAWIDFGPETDVALFEFEIHTLAEKKGINVLDDDGLSKKLDEILRQRAERAVTRR